MKRRVALSFVPFFLCGFLFVADIVTAQAIAYRRANLASNLSKRGQQCYAGIGRSVGDCFSFRPTILPGRQ